MSFVFVLMFGDWILLETEDNEALLLFTTYRRHAFDKNMLYTGIKNEFKTIFSYFWKIEMASLHTKLQIHAVQSAQEKPAGTRKKVIIARSLSLPMQMM